MKIWLVASTTSPWSSNAWRWSRVTRETILQSFCSLENIPRLHSGSLAHLFVHITSWLIPEKLPVADFWIFAWKSTVLNRAKAPWVSTKRKIRTSVVTPGAAILICSRSRSLVTREKRRDCVYFVWKQLENNLVVNLVCLFHYVSDCNFPDSFDHELMIIVDHFSVHKQFACKLHWTKNNNNSLISYTSKRQLTNQTIFPQAKWLTWFGGSMPQKVHNGRHRFFNHFVFPMVLLILCCVFLPSNCFSFQINYPYKWHPDIVDTQVLAIGNLIIGAMPGEFTTMSGR